MSRYQLLPPLAEDEYTSLIEDIRARGVLQPIIVDETGEIIDGHHRKTIADSYGLPCPALKCPPNLSEAEKRSLALDLNMHRRHLSREQKRELIRNSLAADPSLSDRQHAERVGASPTTVGAVRDDMEEAGELSNLDSRTGADGVERPAHITTTTRTTEATKIERDIDLATGEILGDDPIAEFATAVETAAAPAPTPLTRAEQRAIDIEEGRARHARNLERLISLWPWINTFATNPDRDDVIGRLTEHDRYLLAQIEARITGDPITFTPHKEAC